jgi:hypothetical protein
MLRTKRVPARAAGTAKILKFRVSKLRAFAALGPESGAVRIRIGERRELLRVGNGEFAQQHGIEHTEDGSVRADTEGQGQYRHGGETRVLQQEANGVAQVLEKRAHASPPLRLETMEGRKAFRIIGSNFSRIAAKPCADFDPFPLYS